MKRICTKRVDAGRVGCGAREKKIYPDSGDMNGAPSSSQEDDGGSVRQCEVITSLRDNIHDNIHDASGNVAIISTLSSAVRPVSGGRGIDVEEGKEKKVKCSSYDLPGPERHVEVPDHILSPRDFEVKCRSSCSSPEDGDVAVLRVQNLVGILSDDGEGKRGKEALESRRGRDENENGDDMRCRTAAETGKGNPVGVERVGAGSCISRDDGKLSFSEKGVVDDVRDITENDRNDPSILGSIGVRFVKEDVPESLRKQRSKDKLRGGSHVRFDEQVRYHSVVPGTLAKMSEERKGPIFVERPGSVSCPRRSICSVGLQCFENCPGSHDRGRSGILHVPSARGERTPRNPSHQVYKYSSSDGRLLSPVRKHSLHRHVAQQPGFRSPSSHRVSMPAAVLSSAPSQYPDNPFPLRCRCRHRSCSSCRLHREERSRGSGTESSGSNSVDDAYLAGLGQEQSTPGCSGVRRCSRVPCPVDGNEEDVEVRHHPSEQLKRSQNPGYMTSCRDRGCPRRQYSCHTHLNYCSNSEESVEGCRLPRRRQEKRARSGIYDGLYNSNKRVKPVGNVAKRIPSPTQHGYLKNSDDEDEHNGQDEKVATGGLVTAKAMHRRYRRNKEPRPLGTRRLLEWKGAKGHKDEIVGGTEEEPPKQQALTAKEFRMGRKVLGDVMRQRGLEIDKIAKSACSAMRMPSWYDGAQPVQDLVNAFADLGNDGFLPFLHRIRGVHVKEISVWQSDLQVLENNFMALGMRHFASVVSKLHELYEHGDIARGVQLGRAARLQLLAALRQLETPSVLQYFGRLPLEEAAALGLSRKGKR